MVYNFSSHLTWALWVFMGTDYTSGKHLWTCSVFSGELKAPGIRQNSDLGLLQRALSIVRKKHCDDVLCTSVLFKLILCDWSSQLWIWTLGILGLCGRSDAYSELVYLDRWHAGLQALAFNQCLQWQHVGWNQTITLYQVTCKLRAFTKSQRTQAFTVTFPRQRVHQYGE